MDRWSERTRAPFKGAARRVAQFTVVISVLLLGVAHAADVAAVYMNGQLHTPQIVAGLGFHSIGFINEGTQKVTFNVYHLRPGTHVADLVATSGALREALQANQDVSGAMAALVAQAEALGGAAVSARNTTDIYVDFEQGTYVVTVTPSDGVSSTRYASFIATAGADSGSAPPILHAARLSDSATEIPRYLADGNNLWQIVNTASQPRMAQFYKLLPGRTVQDLEAFLNGQQQNMAKPYDKTVKLELLTPGATVYLPINLSSGTWAAR